MTRGRIFLITNLVFLLLSITVCFLAGRRSRMSRATRVVQWDKSAEFIKQATILDSLYRRYQHTLGTGDMRLKLSSQSAFANQLDLINQVYADASLHGRLVRRLVSNYRIRGQLQSTFIDRMRKRHLEMQQMAEEIAGMKKANAQKQNELSQIRILGGQ